MKPPVNAVLSFFKLIKTEMVIYHRYIISEALMPMASPNTLMALKTLFFHNVRNAIVNNFINIREDFDIV
jgi:hypothetical protein